MTETTALDAGIAPERPRPLLIQGVRLVDGRGVVVECGDLLVDDGRIVRMGVVHADSIGPAVDVRDGSGLTVVPGLMNAHVHVTMDGSADPGRTLLAQDRAQTLADARTRLDATVRAGVTTVRDLGAPDGLAIGLAAEVESGSLEGPRILAAGRPICSVGGHGHTFMSLPVSSEAEAAAAARAQIGTGARALKLMATGGMMTPGQVAGEQQLSEAEMAAAIRVARAAGVPVAAHSEGIAGTLAAVSAGVSSIEHGHGLDQQGIDLMLAAGVALVPTLLSDEAILVHGVAAGIPRFVVEACERLADSLLPGFEAAVRQGVIIVAGNDGGAPLVQPGQMADELALYVRHGMSPLAALDAATRAAARLFGLDDVGTLEVGNAADLVAVRGDPLTDIGKLRDPVLVVARGRVIMG